jgi:hypothetical protein
VGAKVVILVVYVGYYLKLVGYGISFCICNTLSVISFKISRR